MELKELYALIERFEKTGLSELTFKRNGEEVTLKKGIPAPAPVAAVTPSHALSASAGRGPSADAPARASDVEVIRAPIVGTFYRAPAPDAAPFIEKGDKVKKGQTICILEAMKLMNEFQAEFDLEIIGILADNGKMVEFGTPLFEVRRA
jgi:acetyl-CoA carboxylase biotin carboxyl carrier protein